MKLEFEFNGEKIPFKLEYRKRKTFEIKINIEGEVIVLSPIGVNSDKIIDLVKGKGPWIIRKRNEIKEIACHRVDRNNKSGDLYLYLGKEYKLDINIIENTKKINIYIEEDKLILNSYTNNKEIIKKALKSWYKERTLEEVQRAVEKYQIYFKKTPTDIRAKEQKRRWATCTGKDALLFNLRCSMAPTFVIESIVVHEMCHMEHKNHSKDFWNEVYRVFPEYDRAKIWLKENGIKMDV